MHCSCLLSPVFLLISAPVFGQSTATDSQTLQALLAEVRQLHHDLQTTTVPAQRAQILLYRLQGQEVIVARASQRLDDARAKLAEIQSNRTKLTSDTKKYEDLVSQASDREETDRGFAFAAQGETRLVGERRTAKANKRNRSGGRTTGRACQTWRTTGSIGPAGKDSGKRWPARRYQPSLGQLVTKYG